MVGADSFSPSLSLSRSLSFPLSLSGSLFLSLAFSLGRLAGGVPESQTKGGFDGFVTTSTWSSAVSPDASKSRESWMTERRDGRKGWRGVWGGGVGGGRK